MQENSMMDILELMNHQVVTIIGAGGKTSLMYYLARQMADQGKRVLITTTTKIFHLSADTRRFVAGEDLSQVIEELGRRARTGEYLVAGRSVQDGKIIGFEPRWIDELKAAGIFDLILVEGDGSARKSLKAPALHEPVVPDSTTLLLAVMGLQVLGLPLSGDVVHRLERFSLLTGLKPQGKIELEHYYQVFLHPDGYNLGKEKQLRQVVPIINQADSVEEEEIGLNLAKLFLEAGLAPVLITSFSEPPVLRRVCRC